MGLDIKPVIVTALFDIGRDKWSNFTQSYGGYLDWMERTLSIEAPMVIFTEEKFKDRIEEMVSKYSHPYEIIVDTKEELLATQLHSKKLWDVMESEEFKNKIHFDVPEMTQPWYNIMMYNKMWWLLQASEKMEGTHYVWTDAACYREDIKDVNKPFPTERIGDKPIFFSHHQNISIENQDDHILSQMRFIQGGSFIIPKEQIEDLGIQIYKLIETFLDKGLVGSDEKYFDFLYLQNKEQIEIIQCGWREYIKKLQEYEKGVNNN